MSTAISATENGVFWAAGMAEWIVTMDDGSERYVAVAIEPDAKGKAMAKAELDVQQEASQ